MINIKSLEYIKNNLTLLLDRSAKNYKGLYQYLSYLGNSHFSINFFMIFTIYSGKKEVKGTTSLIYPIPMLI